jgi:hypothetical protein
MSYLFQFDDNYNSEDDSDYVPGESDDSSEDSYDSDNSDESSEDSESDTVTEIKLKDWYGDNPQRKKHEKTNIVTD